VVLQTTLLVRESAQEAVESARVELGGSL